MEASSPKSNHQSCRACGTELASKRYVVRERQLGIGGDFEYGECDECGSLSIIEVPADLERYYGRHYYSFVSSASVEPSGWRRWESKVRKELSTELRLDRIARRVWRRLGVPHGARILDVGCGSGKWLHQLHSVRYRNLCGIDAFLAPELERTSPFRIYRKSIEDMDGGWDLISYHHVLEHVVDPVREIAAARERLRPGGILLVRVPVADCWARRRFGTCWLQWDAPRHLWLPTRRALHQLASKHQFSIEYEADDSVAFSIWASQGYARGFSGFDHGCNPSRGTLKTYLPNLPFVLWQWAFSAWLNLTGQGDQVTMIWRKRS